MISWANAAAMGFTAAVMAAFVWATEDPPQPPIVGDIWLEPLNSPVPVGDKLRIRSHRVKMRDDCPVTSVRYAVNADGQRINLPVQQWRGGNPDDPYVDLVFDTSALPSGNYQGHAAAFYSCPDGVFEYKPDAFLFRVVSQASIESEG